MTPAEAAAIAERHVVHPRAHGDRDVFTHGFDFCNEDKQRWPCDAHRAATAYLASVAALDDLAHACRSPETGVCRLCGVPASTLHELDCAVNRAVDVLHPGWMNNAAALRAYEDADKVGAKP